MVINRRGRISREDMLELTRRMNLKRNCFSRIAGAYMDEEGYVDGTFNIHFQKLSPADRTKNLEIAKKVLFSKTNVNLKEYIFEEEDKKPGGIWQLLKAIKESELRNDALLDVFYEVAAENYRSDQPYAVYLFYGNYDVPLKAKDKESLWDSEEVYQFLVCAVCPVHGDYEAEAPVHGFLFPAFKDRSSDESRINIFYADPGENEIQFLF